MPLLTYHFSCWRTLNVDCEILSRKEIQNLIPLEMKLDDVLVSYNILLLLINLHAEKINVCQQFVTDWLLIVWKVYILKNTNLRSKQDRPQAIVTLIYNQIMVLPCTSSLSMVANQNIEQWASNIMVINYDLLVALDFFLN